MYVLNIHTRPTDKPSGSFANEATTGPNMNAKFKNSLANLETNDILYCDSA